MDYSLITQLRSSADEVITPLWYTDIPQEQPVPVSEFHQGDLRGFQIGSEAPPSSGVLCVSDKAAAMVGILNEKKAAFQVAVKAIRQSCAADKSESWLLKSDFSRLMEQIIERGSQRSPEFKSVLKLADISGINLIWAFRQVRLLEKGTRSVSWTWLVKHGEITRVTVESALELAKKLPMESDQEFAIQALNGLPKTEKVLAYRKRLLPQLRANLVIGDPALPSSALHRKMVVAPSIVLMPANNLPVCKWQSLETFLEKEARKRGDVKIEAQAWLPKLSLYRYLPQFRDYAWQEEQKKLKDY